MFLLLGAPWAAMRPVHCNVRAKVRDGHLTLEPQEQDQGDKGRYDEPLDHYLLLRKILLAISTLLRSPVMFTLYSAAIRLR